MAAVTRQSILVQLFRDDKWQAGILPLAVTSRHRDDILVAEILKCLGCVGRAGASRTINNDRLFLFGYGLLYANFQKSPGKEGRTRQVAFVPFLFFTDIEKNDAVVLNAGLHILNARFFYLFPDLCQEVS